MSNDDENDAIFRRAGADLRHHADDVEVPDALRAALGKQAELDLTRFNAGRDSWRPWKTRTGATVAIAAGLLVAFVGGWTIRGAATHVATVSAATEARGERMVEFAIAAPSATHVSLVGEFNNWNATATPMTAASDNTWRVTLPLPYGRHAYAFIVDDTRWVNDPQAPISPEPWFGEHKSVVLVGRREQ